MLNIDNLLSQPPQFKLAVLYSSPKARWTELKKAIEEAKQKCISEADVPVILTGDFNVDLIATKSHPILQCVCVG